MKEKYMKINKSIKIFLIAFSLTFFAGKILYDLSPLLIIESALKNTFNKYKADFSGAGFLLAQLSYNTDDGKEKTINTLFDDTVVGLSLNGPDAVYYTIPVESIKTILKSEYITDLFLSDNIKKKNRDKTFFIPALLSVELNGETDLKYLFKNLSEIALISNNSFLKNRKSYSFIIPAQTASEIINHTFLFEAQDKTKLKRLIHSNAENYLLDIELSANSLREIRCVTPVIEGTSYSIEINFEYPRIYINIENNSKEGKRGDSALVIYFANKDKDNKYRQKSIYSLTVGELIEIGRMVSDKP